MEVDQGVEGQFARVRCAGLEAEQGVEVDRSDLKALSPGVVGVDRTPRADRVLLVVSVARPGLGQTKGHAHHGLQLPAGGGAGDQVGQVSEDTLE